MKIAVRSRGVQMSDALREHVARRVYFQLSRFSDEVAGVQVRIEDVNGPRGGFDKRCDVMVRGPGLDSVRTENLSPDVYAAVDLAIERAARALRRQVGRARATRRTPRFRPA